MSKRLLIMVAVVVVGFIGLIALTNNDDSRDSAELLRPVDTFQHAHGLAIDVVDSSKVYVATHNGLFMLQNDTDLYQVGPKTDDYMGFSTHPTDGDTFYASGHPQFGGNLGFQKTTDGGRTWELVSKGVDGPVDFHALAVSRANPDVIYGWYMGNLHRSLDGGKEWKILDTDLEGVIALVSHPNDEKTVYAATATGIQMSKNHGEDWSVVASNLDGSPVMTFAINPSNPDEWIAFSDSLGFVKSSDGGQAWSQLTDGITGVPISYVAYDNNDSDTIYALSRSNNLYKTIDGGESWQKIR